MNDICSPCPSRSNRVSYSAVLSSADDSKTTMYITGSIPTFECDQRERANLLFPLFLSILPNQDASNKVEYLFGFSAGEPMNPPFPTRVIFIAVRRHPFDSWNHSSWMQFKHLGHPIFIFVLEECTIDIWLTLYKSAWARDAGWNDLLLSHRAIE